MNADEIIDRCMQRFRESNQGQNARDKCLWAVSMQLMEAKVFDADQRIRAVGEELGLTARNIDKTIGNAASRTGWIPGDAPADTPADTPAAVMPVLQHTAKPYMGDCPACQALMHLYSQPQMMEIHAKGNGVSFRDMWETGRSGDQWAVGSDQH